MCQYISLVAHAVAILYFTAAIMLPDYTLLRESSQFLIWEKKLYVHAMRGKKSSRFLTQISFLQIRRAQQVTGRSRLIPN